jgi:hypothetical protein
MSLQLPARGKANKKQHAISFSYPKLLFSNISSLSLVEILEILVTYVTKQFLFCLRGCLGLAADYF